MDDAHTGQVTRSAAEIYEEFFVPALFAEWAPRLADVLGLAAGQAVLDDACGTGVFARAAAGREMAPSRTPSRPTPRGRSEGEAAHRSVAGSGDAWKSMLSITVSSIVKNSIRSK
jgi:hypothetical protein